MGDRGPLPEDPDILKLRGSRCADKREIPISENAPPPKLPQKLGKYGKKLWQEVVADLTRRQLLDASYGPGLELLARAYQRYRVADDALGDKAAGWKSSTDKGYEYPNPLHAIRDKAEATYLKLLDRFGCSGPAVRLKSKSSKPGRKPGVSSRDRNQGRAS